jgi:hypothetical protein
MPVPENIKLQVRVNAGAWTAHEDDPDGITVVANDVVEMRVNNDSGISSYLFQIYDYPTGFALPAGWIQTPGSRIYHSTSQLPPSWTVPATSTTIGRWVLRVVVNNAERLVGGKSIAAGDLIDTIGLDKAFPSGLKDTPFAEGTEFDQLRQGGNAALKNNWRIIEGLALEGGAGQNNIGENVGDGADVYKGMNGVALQIRGIKGDGDRISTSVVGDNVVVAFDDTGLATTDDLTDGDVDVITAEFVFDDPTTDSNPGTAKLKFDAANLAAATRCYINLTDAEGRTLTGLYDSIALGNLRVVGSVDVTHWIELSITDAPVSASGYRKLKIEYSSGPGGFVDEEAVRVQFTRLRSVVVGGDIFDFTWNPDDAGGDPGDGQLALNAAPESATIAYVDSSSVDAGNIDDFLQTCTSGTLTITQKSNVAIRHNYDITGRTDASGFVQFAVVWRSGDGVFEDGAAVRAAFVRTGAISASTGGDTWTFFLDSTTTDADPPATNLRLSSATASAASFAYIDVAAVEGDISGYLDALGSGSLKLTKKTVPGLWNTYDIVEVVSASGYRKLDLTWTDGTGNFVNGDELWAAFGKGSGGGSGSASGLGAVTNGFFKLGGDPTWNDGTTALDYQRLVWIPRWKRWLRLGYDTSNNLSWMRLNDEGAVLSTGIWASESDVASATWTGPILACTGPVAATERVFVAAGRTTGESGLHLRYSDDAGATWNAAELNTATEPSFPGAMVWTGTNLVLAFDTGEIEYGADPNTAWAVATPPDSGTRCQAITDGLGKVLIFRTGASASYAYSANHGATWVTGTLPGSVTVFGAAFNQGNFIVLTTGEQVTRSVDGTSWSALANVTFADPSTAVTMQFATGDQYASRVVAIGDLLVATVRDTGGGSVVDDLYYSSDLGATWYRSGAFSHDIINAADGNHQHLAVGDMQLAVLGFDQSSWLSHRDAGSGSGSGGGEANLLDSVGTGEGTLPAGKTGVTLLVKSIEAGDYITVVNESTQIVISGDEAQLQALIDATLSDVAASDVDASAGFAGDVDKAARENHTHKVLTGTPVELTDTVAGEGVADTLMRSDAQIPHGERGGGPLHPIASEATGDGFVPDPTGVDPTWVVGLVDGAAAWVEPVLAPDADEGLLPSDSLPLDIVSDGAEGPGDGTLGSRWNHTHAIGGVKFVRSVADLPAAVANVRPITAGLWIFCADINDGNADPALGNRLTKANGINATFMSLHDGCMYRTNANHGPALQEESASAITHKRPFTIIHDGDDFGYVGPATGDLYVYNWQIGYQSHSGLKKGGAKIRATARLFGCNTGMVEHASGPELTIDGMITTQVVFTGTDVGSHSRISLNQVRQPGNAQYDITLVKFNASTGLSGNRAHLTMVNCHQSRTGTVTPLVDLPSSFNQTETPFVSITGCSGGQIKCDVIPSGGLVIDSCGQLDDANPFDGFDHLTAGVQIRKCHDVNGDLLPETPNGHIVLDENSDPVAQKHYLQFPGATVANVGEATQVTITAPEPLLAAPMKWSTTVAAEADPGVGYIRGNNATQPSITKLYVDNQSVGAAQNISGWTGALKKGQFVKIGSRASEARFVIGELTADADVNSGFVTLDVTIFTNGTALTNDEEVWLQPYGFRGLALRGGTMDASATLNMNDGQISETDALYVGKTGASVPTTGQGTLFLRTSGTLEDNIEVIDGQGMMRAGVRLAQGTRPALANAMQPVVWSVLHPPAAGQFALTELGRPIPVTGSNSFAVQAESHTWIAVAVSGSLGLFALSYASATEGPFGYNPNGWTGMVTIEGTIDFILHTTVDSLKAAHQSVKYSVSWASRNTAPTCRSSVLCSLNWPFTPSVAASGTSCLIAQAAGFIPSGGARLAASITGRIRAMAHA